MLMFPSTYAEIMAFNGPVPELVNGRLAMMGFFAAVSAEVRTHVVRNQPKPVIIPDLFHGVLFQFNQFCATGWSPRAICHCTQVWSVHLLCELRCCAMVDDKNCRLCSPFRNNSWTPQGSSWASV